MQFITLLIATFATALLVSVIVAQMFRKPIEDILNRIVADTVSSAWAKYMRFAIFVTGVSSGVQFYRIEQFLDQPAFKPSPTGESVPYVQPATILDAAHWLLEIYRTIIQTLQGITWMLLVFFVCSLIAFVIVRAFELRRGAAK